ncbi:Transposase [Oopsacas minuta]|uniref:Transposase n=1 Tax=Oopsacas minuta TaxID=111878 RepID=A0AAV7JMR3_9METZ|nr:Transposase [Oopsacas minuta]
MLKDDNFNIKWRDYIESRKTQDPARTNLQRAIGDIACGFPLQIRVDRWTARLRSGDADVTDFLDLENRRLTEIITGGETWVYYSIPYSKYKKRSWVRGHEQPAKFPRPEFRKPKILYTIFFSSHGIVVQLPCESGKSVIATFFTEQVLPNLTKILKSTTQNRNSRNEDSNR